MNSDVLATDIVVVADPTISPVSLIGTVSGSILSNCTILLFAPIPWL